MKGRGIQTMQIKLLRPFFRRRKTSCILLHGFTGNSADVRQLGRYLQKKGYTSCTQYEGHSAPPEEILKSSPLRMV